MICLPEHEGGTLINAKLRAMSFSDKQGSLRKTSHRGAPRRPIKRNVFSPRIDTHTEHLPIRHRRANGSCLTE
jgi:hypothetical protein